MRFRAASALVVASALAACGRPPPPSQFPTADDAFGRMKATYACVNGVQGVAKVDTFSKEGRVRGDMYLLVLNPDRVRFDVVSPFGVSLFTLVSDGSRFEMLDVKQKELLYGPANACNLARLTQVPVPGHALVSLLRGEAPLLVHDRSGATLEWDSHGFYKATLRSKNDAVEEVHLEVLPDDWNRSWSEQRLRVTDIRVTQRGIDLYTAELGHFEPAHTAPPRTDPEGIDPPVPPSGGACDAELPRSIRIRVPHTTQDVILQYKEALFNPPIVQGAFKLVDPGGVRRVYTDCSK